MLPAPTFHIAMCSSNMQVEGLRGKDAFVQAVVKNIARKEMKEPETRSDDELRTLLRTKVKQSMQVWSPHVAFNVIANQNTGGIRRNIRQTYCFARYFSVGGLT